MTNEEIIRVAMEQSAKDIGCKAEDFCRNDNIVVPFVLGSDAKKYTIFSLFCHHGGLSDTQIFFRQNH